MYIHLYYPSNRNAIINQKSMKAKEIKKRWIINLSQVYEMRELKIKIILQKQINMLSQDIFLKKVKRFLSNSGIAK